MLRTCKGLAIVSFKMLPRLSQSALLADIVTGDIDFRGSVGGCIGGSVLCSA